ncbi:hypothetical protein KIN20_022440 [Parelaphostrongylus tenuis]|uniref:Uncharacterized protein n=1 Tax=Parelaphostrongylus tenuis TaxID=148309 RepID=A0AAD5N657_PARTN|nr:hypothetical protein KIN20_022440 [Parelaphostrongylus tenuis]
MGSVRLPMNPSMILFLAAISTAFGCGVMPAQEASQHCLLKWSIHLHPLSRAFYGIAPNEELARGFVERLVMQTPSSQAQSQVFDVLKRQDRSALLANAVISAILGQLNVTINYKPMIC